MDKATVALMIVALLTSCSSAHLKETRQAALQNRSTMNAERLTCTKHTDTTQRIACLEKATKRAIESHKRIARTHNQHAKQKYHVKLIRKDTSSPNTVPPKTPTPN